MDRAVLLLESLELWLVADLAAHHIARRRLQQVPADIVLVPLLHFWRPKLGRGTVQALGAHGCLEHLALQLLVQQLVRHL